MMSEPVIVADNCSKWYGQVLGISDSPPEWAAIAGDHVETTVRGIVRQEFLAGEDNPLTHDQFSEGDCLIDLAVWLATFGAREWLYEFRDL